MFYISGFILTCLIVTFHPIFVLFLAFFCVHPCFICPLCSLVCLFPWCLGQFFCCYSGCYSQITPALLTAFYACLLLIPFWILDLWTTASLLLFAFDRPCLCIWVLTFNQPWHMKSRALAKSKYIKPEWNKQTCFSSDRLHGYRGICGCDAC